MLLVAGQSFLNSVENQILNILLLFYCMCKYIHKYDTNVCIQYSFVLLVLKSDRKLITKKFKQGHFYVAQIKGLLLHYNTCVNFIYK